jgi:Type II secretion system (T2SS), protein M subtype b
MIWREKRLWLVVLALALAADVFVFVTYRVQFQKRIDDVTERQKEATLRLSQAQAARLSAQDTYKRYLKVQSDLDALYDTKWATQGERLIPWINEVKRLAEASQLVPKVLNFAKDDAKDKESDSTAGTKGKSVAARTVTISYTVEGNYQQVRRLINALELSDQFVIIDTLSVSAGGNPNELTVNLRLKTLFREPVPGAQQAPARSTAAAAATSPNEAM